MTRIKRVRISLCGVNMNRIYRECKKHNIEMFNVDRKDYKSIEFDIDSKDKKLVKNIAKSQRYEFAEKQSYGFAKLKNFLKLRFGILIGAIIFVALNIFSGFFVWNIEIYGNQTVSNEEILNVLKEENIILGKQFANTPLSNVENAITNNLDRISLCSVIKKGTTIIVNVKEKLIAEDAENINGDNDIVALTNLTITELNVINGTALKKVGDSVKAGETIVAGYILDGSGNKISCNVNAKIKAKTWHTATEIYYKELEVSHRTGKKITNSYITFFDMKFNVKNRPNTFEYFEEESKKSIITKNNFLPFYMNTTTFYEIQKEKILQNFDQDKQNVIDRCQKLAYKKVNENETVTRIFETITEEEDRFIVTSYVEVVFEY